MLCKIKFKKKSPPPKKIPTGLSDLNLYVLKPAKYACSASSAYIDNVQPLGYKHNI